MIGETFRVGSLLPSVRLSVLLLPWLRWKSREIISDSWPHPPFAFVRANGAIRGIKISVV